MSALTLATRLIAHFEGCRTTAYQDVAGVWTIGFGAIWNAREGRAVREGDTITEADALADLSAAVSTTLDAVQLVAPRNATMHQVAACTSLAYNIGVGAFRSSLVLRLWRAGLGCPAANHFLDWDHAHVNGQLVVVDGLLNRRGAERTFFLTADSEGGA